MSKADAENKVYTNRSLLEYIFDLNITTDKDSIKTLPIHQLRKYQIVQNFNSAPVKVFPNINIPELPTNILPDSDSSQPKPNIPDTQNQTPGLNKKNLELLILDSLSNSSNKYPWIVYPTDEVKFSSTFKPSNNTNYINFSFNFASDKPIVDHVIFANFPKENQFYWSLPDNRVVMETQGWQAGVFDQGQSTEIESRQLTVLTQKLWGMQAVSVIPQAFKDLTGEINTNQFSIQSIAAEVTTPPGSPTPRIIIDSGNSNSTITSIPRISNFGTATTYNPKGGGSLFELLDADNAPLILQTFPTSNLQPLLDAGSLTRGTVVSQDTLAKIGFSWGNLLTGEPTRFQPQMTSRPGLKIGQGRQFDNWSLLNILINPFLSQKERDLYYLNSLYWVPLGQRLNTIRLSDKQENSYWQRLYISRPHNRILLQYDPVKTQATYNNIFSNPGISLSTLANQGKIDDLQTANTTLGMLMGGVFELIHPPLLQQSLQEAKKRFSQQENFAHLNTKATPEQIRQINQILNRTLLLGNRNSSLSQVSGIFTFPSKITPNSSSILQIRTGNYRRAVQFVDGSSTWKAGQTFISKADISNRSFGPLTFIGVPIPLEQTSIRPSNRASAAQVTLINSNGQQFVQNWNSAATTEVPMSIRSFDLAFDHIELSQVGEIITKLHTFKGYLFLPALEFLWTGSSERWNYSVNSGVWFNLNSDSAFNVANNSLGLPEPTLGIYANGVLSYTNSYLEFDEKGKTQAITTHIPALRFYWNSAANSQNPAYLNLSYFFYHQNQDLNYSLVPALIFVGYQGYLTQAVFLQGKLLFSTGLELNSSLEISNDIFYTLAGTQKLNQNWAIGAYLQNFKENNQGIINRTNDFSYGLTIKYSSDDSNNFWQSNIGMNGDSFGVSFEGGWRF
ncbi:hypothetical protein [Nostoc sp. MS1]|uniref:hypothetical protein n=1 Tax=Nostoc sp. MS1 TaxID=2764711 RepID=UPI001CC6555E|nr:hypothetical protein [Nostoc sp. MS1]BCL35232.1 hypothetical protein NSMS1_16790 [Nostoc sp. MS1]